MAKVVRNEVFPNCFIYCLSQATPSIDLARKIDRCYDDWFEITDHVRFTLRLSELLGAHIRATDLQLPYGTSSPQLHVHTIGHTVAYGQRDVVMDNENFDEAMEPIRNPLKMLFRKPSHHQSIKEYRIAFVITDDNGRPISVKTQPKDITLQPVDPILSTVGSLGATATTPAPLDPVCPSVASSPDQFRRRRRPCR